MLTGMPRGIRVVYSFGSLSLPVYASCSSRAKAAAQIRNGEGLNTNENHDGGLIRRGFTSGINLSADISFLKRVYRAFNPSLLKINASSYPLLISLYGKPKTV